MVEESEIPESLFERASMLEGILIERATGGSPDNQIYVHLRKQFMADPTLSELLPRFVRTYRSLDAYWPYIKSKAPSYAERRQIISAAFTQLLDHLEGRGGVPGDEVVSGGLETFDPEGVHALWVKALERRTTDPEGAITLARTLLERVAKRILDDLAQPYSDKDDLPKLYRRTASVLNLAPNQHSEQPIKAILGGAITMVNGIGTLRNRLSDSHGRGGKLPVKPSARHASLAVNTAGALATFLVETHLKRQDHSNVPQPIEGAR
ncbi:MAG: abortive infection family protein [Rhodospirillaceae bacterium]|nr:abortive infection family protein [Rhodospirillaceae bacterium]MYH36011.1 abortive infection family protein [Rhodospirillaceae bacterium]MYK14109.1 abortive infection family protein [Rhodospirillaceae bacterium]